MSISVSCLQQQKHNHNYKASFDICIAFLTMKLTLTAFTTFLGLAIATPIIQASSAAPSGVTIESISYAGTGCSAGTVAGTFTDDKSLLTLAFDSYVAQSGPSIQTSESRKNCLLTLKLKYPSGYQYSIFTADYRGFAAISSGSTGICKSTYYFSSQSLQVCVSELVT